MARFCTVCSHRQVDAINAELVRHAEGERTIASRYGVSRASLQRHATRHVGALLATAKEVGVMLSAEHLLSRLTELDAKAEHIYECATAANDLRAALGAIREARAGVEAYSRISEMTAFEERLAALEAQANGYPHVDE